MIKRLLSIVVLLLIVALILVCAISVGMYEVILDWMGVKYVAPPPF